jgi:hypothetical protein
LSRTLGGAPLDDSGASGERAAIAIGFVILIVFIGKSTCVNVSWSKASLHPCSVCLAIVSARHGRRSDGGPVIAAPVRQADIPAMGSSRNEHVA